MKALRKLVLGETWAIPLGVAAIVAVAILVGELAPDAWGDQGGPAVLLAAVLVLVACLAGALRRRG